MAQSVGVWWPVCGEANYQTRIFNATDEGIQILIFCLKSKKMSGKKRLWFRVAEITVAALYKAGDLRQSPALARCEVRD